MSPKHFTVSRVAKLTHLTVRALHHYDAIGLLSPSRRSPAGYRLYSEDDLLKLQQVLVFRELGFGLDDVRRLLSVSAEQRRSALLAQRDELERRQSHLDAVIRAVDATLQSLETEDPMNTNALFENNGRFQNGEYAAEAEQRWGSTDAWRESKRRTRSYSDADWAAIHAEADAINADFVAHLRDGGTPTDETAMDLAERHRLHIDRRYYPCSHQMHVNVAAMYTADPRFTSHYDQQADGLAAFIAAAVRANAERHERA